VALARFRITAHLTIQNRAILAERPVKEAALLLDRGMTIDTAIREATFYRSRLRCAGAGSSASQGLHVALALLHQWLQTHSAMQAMALAPILATSVIRRKHAPGRDPRAVEHAGALCRCFLTRLVSV
jgi:hypothetical protein